MVDGDWGAAGRYPEGKTWILPKVIEAGKAKENNWKQNFQSSDEKKRRKRGGFRDQGILREPKMINDTEKKQNKTKQPSLSD